MLISKLCTLRENKKESHGFSLVELIIVIAIMVALVAMLAPQFVKYVQKARDAVVTQAAQDVLSVAKSEFALGHLRLAPGKNEGLITVQTDSRGMVMAAITDLTFDGNGDGDFDDEEDGSDGFENMCGIDKEKMTKSEKVYLIHVEGNIFTSAEQNYGIQISEEVTDGGHSDEVVTTP